MSNRDRHSKQVSGELPAANAEQAKEFTLELGKDADVALLAGPTPDGKGALVLRAKQGRLEAGEIRPLEVGKPIVGDVVSLKPRQSMPVVCDVETHFKAKVTASTESNDARRPNGPPQVASDAYRQNWEAIYSHKQKKPDLTN